MIYILELYQYLPNHFMTRIKLCLTQILVLDRTNTFWKHMCELSTYE